jgi:1-acyl-sn-glycerol-3-phosphate acyltransferase
MEGNNTTINSLDRLVNFSVTIVCWIYFIFAFLFFFSFFYGAAFFFSRNREQAFQYLDHLFFKGFLWLLATLAPCHLWNIDPDISKIQGSVIVCNHRSYLDPLILLSLLPKNKTIVKTKFFQAPVFGWMIKVSGYLPATTEGKHGRRMIEQVESMGDFLRDGGNLFVFPEGTRNRSNVLGDFHKGVFKIARMYRCPIQVLKLCNTDKLFTPGKFFFNTRVPSRISMKIIGCIRPATEEKVISAAGLETEVRQIFQKSSTCTEAGP